MSRAARAGVGARALRVALVALALLVPVALRVALEGRRALSRARQAAAQGDVDAQVEALGRAARWVLPAGLGSQRRALAELEALAHAPGQRPEVALAAHRQVRRALLGTRAWGVGDPELLEHASASLARATLAAGDLADADLAARVGRYHDPASGGAVANLAAASFLLWVLSSLAFVRRGLDARLRLRPAAAVRWGALWLVSLLAWVTLTRAAG